MLSRPPRYCSYLLRCWEEHGAREAGPAAWRFSLEDPHTGERHAFSDLARLTEFVRQRLAADADADAGAEQEGRGLERDRAGPTSRGAA
jgi:hypothetical protein